MDVKDSLTWVLALQNLCDRCDATAESVMYGWKVSRQQPENFPAYRRDVEQRLPLFYARWTAAYLKVRLTE